MSLSDELFLVAEPLWGKQLQHPFVTGLADGSLEENRFRHWVLQDYRYLKEYARVFAWAVAKADGLDSMAWYSRILHLTLNTEMELHRQYAARFGISTTDLETCPMWPTTQAYTDFLVRTAADGDMLDLLGALLPCTWGYVYIAEKVAESPLPGDQRYADWIKQYASQEFADVLAWLRAELDRLSYGIGQEKVSRVKDIFRTSTRYEGLFWDMCWKGESWDDCES